MGWEAELTFKYKTPGYLEFSFSRLLWILTLYYWVYYTFFLGEKQLAFWERPFSNPWIKQNVNDYQPRYEKLYYFDRPTVR